MKKVLIGIIVLIPILFVSAFWIAGSVLMASVNQSVGSCPTDLNCENIEFASDSGTIVKGWLVSGAGGKGAIILMHGVGGNRATTISRIEFLHAAGYSVMAFDFQASGESQGKQITFGYLESRDAEASIKFLREKMPNEKIGVIGISMGGAAFLLQKNPQKVDAVILEMVYPEMRKAIDNRLDMWLFQGADNLTPLLLWQFPLRLGVSADEMRPITKIADIKVPKLLIVGEKDKHTTLEESRQLFAAATETKELWIVPNAEHGDLHKFAPQDYENKVLNFFEKTLRQ